MSCWQVFEWWCLLQGVVGILLLTMVLVNVFMEFNKADLAIDIITLGILATLGILLWIVFNVVYRVPRFFGNQPERVERAGKWLSAAILANFILLFVWAALGWNIFTAPDVQKWWSHLPLHLKLVNITIAVTSLLALPGFVCSILGYHAYGYMQVQRAEDWIRSLGQQN